MTVDLAREDRPDPAKAIALVQSLENRRTAAMKSADLAELERMLDPALIYSHSTGAVDTRASFVEHLRSGFLRYLDVIALIDHANELDQEMLVGVGRLRTCVEVAGTLKALDARYMTIWRRTEGRWALAALQG